MKKAAVVLKVVAVLVVLSFCRPGPAVSGGHRETKEVVAYVELPACLLEEGGEDARSFVSQLLPDSFSIREVSGRRAVLEGPRKALPLLEKAGLEVVRAVPAGQKSPLLRAEAGKAAGSLSFSPLEPWTPLTLPGEEIEELDVDDVDGDGEDEIVVRTENGDETGGNVYVFSWRGVLEGSWSAPYGGLRDVDSVDLDGDGTEELIVQLDDSKSFYVLSHTGSPEWSGTVPDNITNISYTDLNDDGDRELVVFSRDTAVSRGQITVFDPITHGQLGMRSYTAGDLEDKYSPGHASYRDLNGDGIEEIIPNPTYLDKKMEILSYDCTILDVEYFSMVVERMVHHHDFNGDGRDDILVMTSDGSAVKLYGFIGFNGSYFGTIWTYPYGAGTIAKGDMDWDITDSGIAFGTQDEDTFSGCRVYLLNAANGIEAASSVAVSGSVDYLEYMDLDGDGAEEVAVLANTYSDPTHTWTFYVYDGNLNLLVPSGHHSFSTDTGWHSSSSRFGTNNLDGDSSQELIPLSYTGNKAIVVRYTGVLKWEYDAGGEVEDIDDYMDIDGDGNDDLLVASGGPGGTSSVAVLKDAGASYDLLGQRSLPYEVRSVSAHDFNGDDRYEIMPMPQSTFLKRSVFSYDLTTEYWSIISTGSRVLPLDYYSDLDGNGIDDIVLAAYGSGGPNGYVYVFLGGLAEYRRLALMKRRRGGDYNLRCYNTPVDGDWTFYDALNRNPAPLARDLWIIPHRNNALAMTKVDADEDGYGELCVMKNDSRDHNLFLYNAPVDGDWTFLDAWSRNPSPFARDLWSIPRRDSTLFMADAGDYLAVMKSRRGDHNLYLYDAPAPGDWTYWDALARNPSPVARDLWVIPYANDVVGMCGMDTGGDRKADSLLVVREVAGEQLAYLWNIPAPGDWTYSDALARNLLPRAVDRWSITRRDGIELVTGVNGGNGYDELAVMENNGGDYNLYVWNAPRPGDTTEDDALSRNPSPLARDLWVIPVGNNTVGMTAY